MAKEAATRDSKTTSSEDFARHRRCGFCGRGSPVCRQPCGPSVIAPIKCVSIIQGGTNQAAHNSRTQEASRDVSHTFAGRARWSIRETRNPIFEENIGSNGQI